MSVPTPAAYRPELDGLRALAIALVIGHHLPLFSLPGGFVGVDVFFVLSGYLITQLLLRDLQQGRFHYGQFLLRRAMRLLPALLLMLCLTSLAASLLLLPADFARFAHSLTWVLPHLGNVFFWREYGGYFAADSQTAPLLHTWSLAVEEQFYLLWPLALLLLWRMLGPRWTYALVLMGTLAGLLLSEWATRMTIGAAYYLLPTRAFELLAGASLALAGLRPPTRSHPRGSQVGALGLALILGSALWLKPSDRFPGLAAVPVVLGTLLLLLPQAGWLCRSLSHPALLFIGQRSYALYLWHWPILAFLHDRMPGEFALAGARHLAPGLGDGLSELPLRGNAIA